MPWLSSQAGVAAAIQPARGEQHCPLCSQAQMQKLHRTAQGKRALTLRLKQLLATRSACAMDLWARVEEHLGAEAVQYYQRRVAPTTCQGRPDAPCSWHPTQSGAAAKVKPIQGVFRCPLCSAAQMQALHRTARGKQALTLRFRSTDVLQLWALVEAPPVH